MAGNFEKQCNYGCKINFLFNEGKDHALKQIKDKTYFEKYQGAGKKIYLFGVEFSDRNVGEWVVERIELRG